MTDADRQLADDRAQRSAARRVFGADWAQLKADLSARGIGGRIKDSVVQQADEAVATGLAVARENKTMLVGTFGLLLVWIFRNPLGRLIGRIIGRSPHDTSGPDDDRRGPDQE